ncbi:hypothetical protein [Streptomyces sp. NPDC048565]|uniref:hypothetical protein n=1 Tax=Streptomyces sp. NPDC048565 TaxID=3155266 RepID=UPI00343C38DF
MYYLKMGRSAPKPDLGPVKSAVQQALNDASEVERPGLSRALEVIDGLIRTDQGPATVEWARTTLAVAGIDPFGKETKAIQALRAARPGIKIREAGILVREVRESVDGR